MGTQITAPGEIRFPDGLVIDEIEMKGFMRYLSKTDPPIRFREKFTAITGKTGSGKTTVLDAVTFALYKRTTRTDPPANVKISEICRPGGYVKVSFFQGNETYEVKRGFTSGGQAYLELYKGDVVIGGSIPEREKAIVEIVGLDYEGFCNSTFVRQEEMKALGSESGSARLAIFQKLFRLEIFEKAYDRVNEEYKSLREKLVAKEREISVREESVARLESCKARLETLIESVTMSRKKVEEQEALLSSKDVEFQEREREHEEYIRARTALDEKMKRLASLENRAQQALEEHRKSEELRKKLETLEKESATREDLNTLITNLTEAKHQRDLFRERLEAAIRRKRDAEAEHDRKLRELSGSLFEAEKRLMGLTTDVGKEEAFDLLRSEGTLEERIRRIDREIEWLRDNPLIVSQIEAERGEAKTKLTYVKERVGRINSDSFILSEIEKQVTERKHAIKLEDESFAPKLRKLEEDIQVVQRSLAGVKFGKQEEEKLEEAQTAFERLREKSREAEDLRAKLRFVGDVEKLLVDLGEQELLLEDELVRLKSKISALTPGEEKYVVVKRERESARTALEETQKELFQRQGELSRTQETLKELEEEVEKIEEAQAELSGLRGKLSILQILKEEVFHKKGVAAYALNQLLPELEIETSRNLADLTDGRFGRVKLETYEDKKEHGVRIFVETPEGSWRDVSEFSGGERTQINAALRFAIAKELASMPQIGRTFGRMRTLFIDEGDLGSLDTEVSRDLFVQKLFGMGQFFDKIILITHLTDIADRFPGRLRVTMSAEEESKVEVVF